jgi:carotenoid cleavage dioxygenase
MPATANPYLEGIYAPVHEEITATDLPITGRIPDGLTGRYLRNGPNPLEAPEPSTYHWFSGDGMVHGIRLRDGRAEWYRNRWIRAPHIAAALGERGPAETRSHGGMDFGPNTNVIGHAGRIFALIEAGVMPYELTSELDTVGACDFSGTLAGGYTAHPKRDPFTNELYAASYFWGWGNEVEVTVVDTDATVRSARRVTVGGPVSLHDTAITQKWIVLLDLPVLFDLELVRAGSRFPYRWSDDYPSRVGLLPRDGDSTEVIWHEVDPCYVFHTMNAYDQPDTDGIVLDVVRHPSMFRTNLLGPSEGASTLDRWHIDGHGGAVKEERLDDLGQEFPRVDERRTGLPHRYGYSVAVDHTDDILGSESMVVRHDLSTGASQTRSMGPNTSVGEAVFVPTAPDAPEGEGWLMTLVYSGVTDSSALQILNAEDLSGEPQAIIHLPQRIPAGFHGNWIADS